MVSGRAPGNADSGVALVRALTSAREIASSLSGNLMLLKSGSLALDNLPSSDLTRIRDWTALEHTLLVTGVNLVQYESIRGPPLLRQFARRRRPQ